AARAIDDAQRPLARHEPEVAGEVGHDGRDLVELTVRQSQLRAQVDQVLAPEALPSMRALDGDDLDGPGGRADDSPVAVVEVEVGAARGVTHRLADAQQW